MTNQRPEAAPEKTESAQKSTIKAEPKLHMARYWDVSTNPPSNSVKGNIVPTFLTRARRRLSVEVYRVFDGSGGYFEECFVRILVPASREVKIESKLLSRQARKKRRGDSSMNESSADIDDASSLLDGSLTLGDDRRNNFTPSYDGWQTKYKLPLSGVAIKAVEKRIMTCVFSFLTVKQTRKICFNTESEALDCAGFFDSQRELNEKRLQQKFAQNSSGINVTPAENLALLIEIVGATGIPAGDLTSSDPYVVCYFNHRRVHQTKHVSKTLEPIWTIKTKGIFLLECSAEELFGGDGLHLDVMDFDALGDHERLGYAEIDPRSMYSCNGERIKLALEGKDATGNIAIRIRHATAYDKNFMKEFAANDVKKHESGVDKAFMKVLAKRGGKNAIQSALSRNVKVEKHAFGLPVKKYRVRPGPDPDREEETTWLTMEQMEREVYAESREWVDAGSGSLGRLFVEVLSCQGLPNLDIGGFTGNFSDAFACLVFEDVWGQTDVIDDDLNPKWMPWSKRAFIFHMKHPSSPLFVGIFDFDALSNHDLIGRVAVNISNLQPDTIYTLTYELYPSGKWSTRDPKGQVTIRIRMEIDDERKLVLSCLEPPKTMYVNVKKTKDFRVLDAVCNGAYDMTTYNTKTLRTYLEELQSYQECLAYVKAAAITLLLWRGHHAVAFNGKKHLIPLHSMVAFLGSVLVVEYPQLIPSFFFFSISWMMFATMMFRRHHPSPWRRCKTFVDIFVAVVWGDSFPPARIEPRQDLEVVQAYERELQERAERELKAAEAAKKQAEEDAEDLERLAELVGDTNHDISTKAESFLSSFDLLKPYLEPFQAYLVVACRNLRYVRNIILWEECYFSFWVTLGSFVLSIVFLFIPWFFLVKWTSRLFVWIVFGPWMKAVDVFYWSPMENMTEEEKQKLKEKAKVLKEKYMAETIEKARINRERTVKLKAIKQFLFGKFIMKVPILKEDRWTDIPLPDSRAVPYTPKGLGLAELAMKEAGYHRIRVPGQHLEGDMIPCVMIPNFTEAPIGQATKEHAQPETDSAAYIKVGSLVAGAAVITYYGIPLASSILSSLFGS